MTGQPQFFLSTIPAETRNRRWALAASVGAFVVFAACVPFARRQLGVEWAFIPFYQSALAVSDFVTAFLLFGQLAVLRSRALLLLGAGYLFTAVIAVPHALTFPGLFTPTGLFGAGPQTTAWLYIVWHAGFPLTVIAYAVLKRRERRDDGSLQDLRLALALTAGTVVAIVWGLTLIATKGQGLLPAVMRGHSYAGAMLGTVMVVWAISFAALAVLWMSRPHSVLDLWLVVVMCAWLADVGLSAVFNTGWFDFGFYAGRVFGLLASASLLLVLLLETGMFYVRFAEERERRLQQVQDELIHVSRLNELGQMVSALAHEVNQPLTAASNYLGAADHLARAAEAVSLGQAVRKAAEQVVRAGEIIQRLRRFAAKGETERKAEDITRTVEEVVALVAEHARAQGAALTIRIPPGIGPAMIDRVQIQQVLLNLLRNAIEAMAGSPRRELSIAVAAPVAGLMEIAVADTGPGLAPEVRERLFQPFVTTKPNGMGVGLSICRGIVETHGGRLWATDNAGGGTIFHFTLVSTTGSGLRRATDAAAETAKLR